MSPHPSIPAHELQPILARGIPILPGSAADHVGSADLFVASVSTTIKWALACGVPVVNYDVYGYGYDDYRGVPGVEETATFAAFREAVARLCDPPHLETARQLAGQHAEEWGRLDGRSTHRLVALIERALAVAAGNRIASAS